MCSSAIGTHRSALSNYLPKVEGHSVGAHPLVVRLMKGIRNSRPSIPRYTTTWDSDVVVNYLRNYDHSNLKNLTLKLTMLLALITAQRAQTLSKLKLSEMEIKHDRLIFRIGEALKTKAPGTALVQIREYHLDRRVCAVSLIKDYINKTHDLREKDDHLIISFVKPHKAVHVDTIRRWIALIMTAAGINTDLYKPHSTRAASTSKAKFKLVPLVQIMGSAMWSKSSTFGRFYDKIIDVPVDNDEVAHNSFQHAVLTCDNVNNNV